MYNTWSMNKNIIKTGTCSPSEPVGHGCTGSANESSQPLDSESSDGTWGLAATTQWTIQHASNGNHHCTICTSHRTIFLYHYWHYKQNTNNTEPTSSQRQIKYPTSTPVENDRTTHRRTTSFPTLPLGPWTEDAAANAKWVSQVHGTLGQAVESEVALCTQQPQWSLQVLIKHNAISIDLIAIFLLL